MHIAYVYYIYSHSVYISMNNINNKYMYNCRPQLPIHMCIH